MLERTKMDSLDMWAGITFLGLSRVSSERIRGGGRFISVFFVFVSKAFSGRGDALGNRITLFKAPPRTFWLDGRLLFRIALPGVCKNTISSI